MVPALYTIAALLALAWLALTLWALFHDRSRGRRRCPKCFFSLEGLDAARCPECGRTIGDERCLFRTRRRWRAATLGAALLLIPAAITGGAARVKQAGAWADVPSGVVVRLLWLDDQAIQAEALDRIDRAEVSLASAEMIARHAAAGLSRDDRRRDAYTLLDMLSRNDYGRADNDRRPMLEELAPDRTVPALLARLETSGPAERASVLYLLSHLRDADERANIAILARLGDDDPSVAEAAENCLTMRWRESPSVRRLPEPPRLLRRKSGHITLEAPHAWEDKQWLGKQVDACGFDRVALLGLAHRLARGEIAGPSGDACSVLLRTAGLWFACRLAPDQASSLDLVEEIIAAGEPDLRWTAVQQLGAFSWSDRVEGILRVALADPDPRSAAQFEATRIIAKFGKCANTLVPDMLAYARSSDPKSGSSDFPSGFAAAGGRPEDLLAALLDRLAEGRRRLEVGELFDPGFDFRWIADLGLRDAAGAQLVEDFIERHMNGLFVPHNDVFMALVAHAVLTGDGAYATRALLERDPDLNGNFITGSLEGVLLELCQRGLVDRESIVRRYVEWGDAGERLAFIRLLAHLPKNRLTEYRATMDLLATDSYPAVAAAAAKLIPHME